MATAEARRVAVRCVDLLGERVAPIGNVAGDGVGIGWVDLADFLDRRLIVEIEMLKADQERVAVCRPIAPRTASRNRRISARVFW